MGLHQRHAHGRVFVGEEARQYLTIRRRDSHGDHIKMNVPAGFPPPAQKDEVVQTIVSQIFVTVPPSFSGPPDSLSTSANTEAQPPAMTQTHDKADSTPTTSSEARPPPRSSEARSTSTPSTTANRHQPSHDAVSSTFVTTRTTAAIAATDASDATDSETSSSNDYDDGSNNSSMFLNSPGAARASSTGVLANNAASSQDMGSGVKAGIAVGVVLGFALLGALLFFCLRRRRNRNTEDGHTEKHESMFGAQQRIPEAFSGVQQTPRSASTAPRLSLRPVTQFLPNLGENRKSTDILSNMTGGTSKSMWERRQQGPAENPFVDASIPEKSRPQTPNANPFDENQAQAQAEKNATSPPASGSGNHSQKSSYESSALSHAAGAAPAAAAAGVAGTVAGAAPGRVTPPGQRGPNNVHRVQLDFKPSMDDELELRSGQLVRMLHEYDDGWALCVRMDRSQQGVCPRTCLSKLPVKPRQGPPPNGPNSRPYGPGMGPNAQPRPASPAERALPNSRPRMPAAAGPRPDSSQMFNPNGMFPRPLTPTGNSERAESPNNPRKAGPVPGQAF